MICYEVIEAVFEDVRANVNFVMNLIASRGKKINIKLIDDLEVEKKKSFRCRFKDFPRFVKIVKQCR